MLAIPRSIREDHGVYNGNPEAVGDFMASMPLGLLRAEKGKAELAPQVLGGPKGHTWQGVKDLVGGGLQATQIPSAFVTPEAGEVAAEGADRLASPVVKAVNAFRESAAQPELRAGIKSTVGTVAKEAGVSESESASFYKMVEQTADNIKAQASDAYKQLDEVSGGRFQRFQDRLDNIKDAIGELTGTEEDVQKEASLLKAQKETEDSMQEVFTDAKTKGIDPSLIDKASAQWKQSQSLYDVDNAVQKSLSGKPLDIGGKKGLPETIDPKKFAPRINALYKSGRLQDALGEQNAERLANFANDAQQFQRRAVMLKQVLKITGLVGLGGGVIGGVGHVVHAVTPVVP